MSVEWLKSMSQDPSWHPLGRLQPSKPSKTHQFLHVFMWHPKCILDAFLAILGCPRPLKSQPSGSRSHPETPKVAPLRLQQHPRTPPDQAIRATNAQNKSPHSSLGLQMSARSRILGAQWCKMPPSTNPSICKSSNFLCPIPQSSACRWGAGGRGHSPVDTPRQSFQDCR